MCQVGPAQKSASWTCFDNLQHFSSRLLGRTCTAQTCANVYLRRTVVSQTFFGAPTPAACPGCPFFQAAGCTVNLHDLGKPYKQKKRWVHVSQCQPAPLPCVVKAGVHQQALLQPSQLLGGAGTTTSNVLGSLVSHRLPNYLLAGCAQSTWPLSHSERLALKASGASASSVESWSRFTDLRE